MLSSGVISALHSIRRRLFCSGLSALLLCLILEGAERHLQLIGVAPR